MSWIQKLYETYESCQSMIGKVASEKEAPLLPICHTTNKAQIEIVIDHQGNFKRARVVTKDDARTIIPCTESSGGRTSGEAPHPLCDKLQYVAVDYSKYSGDNDSYYFPIIAEKDFKKLGDKVDKKGLIEELCRQGYIDKSAIIQSKFAVLNDFTGMVLDLKWNKKKEQIYKILLIKNNQSYSKLLSDWCESKFRNEKVCAVLEYVKKGRVIEDLVNSKILFVDKDGKLLEKRAEKKQDSKTKDIFDLLPGRLNKKGELENWQADAFIRWEVESPNDPCSKVWEDKTLWDNWIGYYSNIKTDKSLCYVTGKELLGAEQHPAKLRHDGDKAKLISSNDTSGFTFRGRFTDAGQACGVGFEITQKSHSALRWLISRQGSRIGDQAVVVAWATSGVEIPDPLADPLGILGEDNLQSDDSDNVSVAQNISIKLRHKIAGYKAELGDTSGVVVMGIDSATPGRMAITFYRELTGSEFLDRLEKWHDSCAWLHDYGYNPETKKRICFVGAPAPKDIAEAAFGHYENDRLVVDDKIKKSTVERLMPCIIDNQQIPRDLVESVTRRATNRVGFKKNEDWNKTLSIACALFRKLNEKEGYSMALDAERKARDYLYGRLLAAADCMERFALVTSEKKRDTNAARLMQRFADRPCSTWKTIELSLIPYKARLGGRAKKYQDVIDHVHSMFDPPEDYTSDKKLSGEFLLGYHCQREALKPKKDEPKSIEDDNLVEE